jgi:predicted outer membrane repeat protein
MAISQRQLTLAGRILFLLFFLVITWLVASPPAAAQTAPPPAAQIALTKTVGLAPDVCSANSTLAVEPGVTVYYCFTVQNTGSLTLTRHFLEDSDLGFRSFHAELAPGTMLNTMNLDVTFSATINLTTTNTAVWTAQPFGYEFAQATAQATVFVLPCSVSRIIYVDATATGANNGASWADAYPSVQQALATPGSIEIWVATGTYKPTTGADRIVSFTLKPCAALYGGFAGNETMREQRDWVTYRTVLNGDIGVPGDNSDNSYHVVTSRDTDATAVLDGFIITGGNATGPAVNGEGAGLYNEAGSPTLTNINFVNNSATWSGGGLIIRRGGPRLTHVTFDNNSASQGVGGGLYNEVGNPTLIQVTFARNTADLFGGGMYDVFGESTLTNVTFADNSAGELGGGLFSDGGNVTLTNVTIAHNSANNGGGIFNVSSTVTVRNSILAENSAAMGADCFGNFTSQGYNLIGDTAGCTIEGNTTGNLLGVDPLLGPLQDNGGSTLTHALLAGSPAIDAGNPAAPGSGDFACAATDQRGVVRPQDGNEDGTAHCDMGAYEREPGTLDGPTGGQGDEQEQEHHLHLPLLNHP